MRRCRGNRTAVRCSCTTSLPPGFKAREIHDLIVASELRFVSFSELEGMRRLVHGAEHTPRSVATSDSRGVSSIAFC